jgi:hypothetical protein
MREWNGAVEERQVLIVVLGLQDILLKALLLFGVEVEVIKDSFRTAQEEDSRFIRKSLGFTYANGLGHAFDASASGSLGVTFVKLDEGEFSVGRLQDQGVLQPIAPGSRLKQQGCKRSSEKHGDQREGAGHVFH